MKSAVVLAVIVGAVFGAPTKDTDEILRTKKSPSYGSPCGGGTPLAPVTLYLAQPGIQPHYRENEHDEHLMQDKARSYYDGPAGSLAGVAAAPSLSGEGLHISAGAPSAPAVGLFPNAKVGGCAVPLLLSCAPNVVSGYLSHHASSGSGYHAGYGSPAASAAVAAYRDHEHEHKMREAAEKEWSEVQRSNVPATADTHEAQATHQQPITTSFHQHGPAQNVAVNRT